jgi:hypothetical protein
MVTEHPEVRGITPELATMAYSTGDSWNSKT